MNWKIFKLLDRRPAPAPSPAAPEEVTNETCGETRHALDLTADPTQPDLFDDIGRAQGARKERQA